MIANCDFFQHTTVFNNINQNDFDFWQKLGFLDKPINCQCCPHIETSQLICTANQLTGVYIRATATNNGLSKD